MISLQLKSNIYTAMCSLNKTATNLGSLSIGYHHYRLSSTTSSVSSFSYWHRAHTTISTDIKSIHHKTTFQDLFKEYHALNISKCQKSLHLSLLASLWCSLFQTKYMSITSKYQRPSLSSSLGWFLFDLFSPQNIDILSTLRSCSVCVDLPFSSYFIYLQEPPL